MEKESAESKKRTNERALARFCLTAEKSCFSHIMSSKTSREAWIALEKAYAFSVCFVGINMVVLTINPNCYAGFVLSNLKTSTIWKGMLAKVLIFSL